MVFGDVVGCVHGDASAVLSAVSGKIQRRDSMPLWKGGAVKVLILHFSCQFV